MGFAICCALRRRGIALAAIVGLIAMLSPLGSRASAQADDWPKTAFDPDPAALTAILARLRPIDDPQNPYSLMYGPWDQWTYDALRSEGKGEYTLKPLLSAGMYESDYPTNLPSDWILGTAYIDRNGFLVPELASYYSGYNESPGLTIRESFTHLNSAWPHEEYTYVLVYGPPGDNSVDDLKRLAKARTTFNAMHSPRIPMWLGEHPPLQCLFVPNGDILCLGELGAQRLPDANPSGEILYRYSAEGQLLGTYPRLCRYSFIDEAWKNIYWPEHEVVINSSAAQERGLYCYGASGGYSALCRDSATDGSVEVVELYDYDGSRPDPDSLFPLQRNAMCWSKDGDEVEELYAEQLGLCLVPQDSASPFEGQGDGPVRSDGVARIANVVAGKQPGDAVDAWTVALDPALPGNPYSEQYVGLEYYLGQMALWSPLDGDAERDKLIAKLYAHLHEAPRDTLSNAEAAMLDFIPTPGAGLPQDFELCYDAKGWLLPLSESFRLTIDYPEGSDLRPGSRWEYANPDLYYVNTRIEMTPEASALIAELRNNAYWQTWPTIPDWLMEKQFALMLRVPNGEFILLQPPMDHTEMERRDFSFHATMSWPELPLNQPFWRSAERWQESYFERYSADGVLLETRPVGKEGVWQEMYCPGLEARAEMARYSSEGPASWESNVFDFRGIIFIRTPSDTRTPADGDKAADSPGTWQAFDWDGRELDITQRIARPGPDCKWLEGIVMHQVYEGQHGQRSGEVSLYEELQLILRPEKPQ